MPLTPEEQQELSQLQTKYAPKQQGGLSPQEQAELAQLHQKFGGQTSKQPQAGSLIDAFKSGGLSNAYDTAKANIGAYDKFQNQNPIQSKGPMDTLMKMGVTPGSGVAALGSYLGKSGILPAIARVATGAASGAAQGGLADGAEGAKTGALVGGGLGAAGEGIGGITQLAKWAGGKLARMTAPQAEQYLNNPQAVGKMRDALQDPSQMPALQDKAAEAIQNSRGVLKAQGLANASKLRTVLDGKSVTINPNEYLGLDPRVDEALHGALSKASSTSDPVQAFKQMSGPAVPDQLAVDANLANQLKRYLQEGASFTPGTYVDPIQAAKQPQLARAAAGLRSSIERVSPDVSALNGDMQQSVLLQKALRQGGKNSPLAFVSTESPDRVATLARAENAGAGGLLDFGNQLGAAKTMTRPDQGSGIPTFLNKLAGRTLMRGADAVQTPPDANQALIQTILPSLFSKYSSGVK